ncbi:hypothetical protein [Pleomorphovibrio marinus]|uniref:hypothetical protein n=1 Tax=Pleomorphovibrio marinus TaxID=2164132 RepID=UPI000E0B4F86|nr:hypothetical protein [Pleomorphovibrio marinus]
MNIKFLNKVRVTVNGVNRLIMLVLIILSIHCNPVHEEDGRISTLIEGIKPWSENPRYWSYRDEPVLLLGATNNDNLFQNQNLKGHLDSLKAVGGNYVRNTMSDRDEGDERAFAKNADGLYDLNTWNDTYWQKFENLLQWAEEREIIIQIEIWDRFDHARQEWQGDPFNPKNNVNYTYDEAKLDSIYPDHPGANKQPFFFTTPNLDNNEVLLSFQQAFVKKLLSISLEYDNVLYCIDNETSGVEEWATYWAEFIRENDGGKTLYLTQMWDDWDLTSTMHKRTLDHPERYDYIDISQNSHKTGQENWDNAQYVFQYIKDSPRPVNSTKIYGSDAGPWLERGINSEHALQTFFRNILGGFASSRFHRPPHGLSLSSRSAAALKTIRAVEEKVKLWDVEARMDLLSNVSSNEAFLAAKEGEKYLLYFPANGEVELQLSGTYELHWIDVTHAEWKQEEKVSADGSARLSPPGDRGFIGVILKK